MRRSFIILIITMAASVPAYSWGGLGHKIVVEVAKRHLTERAERNIAKLIPYDITKDAGWMDAHRRDSNLLYAFHFHEQCINLKTREYDPNQHVECGDIMRALWLADYNLSHRRGISDSIATLNLRMLLHFVGEMHCPVHLGIPMQWQPRPPYRQDMGKWYWKGKAYGSFHQFIDRVPIQIFPGMKAPKIAEKIDNVSKREAKAFVKGDFVDWTNDAVKGGFRIYDYFPPLWEIPDSPEPKYIPDDYVDNIKDIITLELVKGGYQLAYLLNLYFDTAQ